MAPDFNARVTIRASVSPSEDSEKVTQAVTNVAGGSPGEIRRSDTEIRYRSDDIESLAHLRNQLRDRRVRAAARRLLTDSEKGGKSGLMLNRQAAAAGVMVLCGSPEESPLGPIYLNIESDRLDQLIEWLTAYEGG